MHAKAIRLHDMSLTIRPLRSGDREVVQSVFDQLGDRSRALRFGGAKPALTRKDLDALATVDVRHHALVAYDDGSRTPIGIARLVVDAEDSTLAVIAIAVADDWQSRGVGTALMTELAADARAAGIRRFGATARFANRAAVSLLRRIGTVDTLSYDHGEIELTATLAPVHHRRLRVA